MSVYIIGIAGGSGSGKSTFTRRLKERFHDDIALIYHDNYYKDQSDLSPEERALTNYDHPDALETDLLYEHLLALKEGHSISCPVYDFNVHNRSDQMVLVDPRPVVLVEGILVLADPRLCDLFDLKIFVDADADERVLRRIVRDVRKRGRDLEGIIDQYLTTVKPMHYHYVEPSRYRADLVLNSGKNGRVLDLVTAWIEHIIVKVKEG